MIFFLYFKLGLIQYIRLHLVKSFIRNAFLLLKNTRTTSLRYLDQWVIDQNRFLCHTFIYDINEKNIYENTWQGLCSWTFGGKIDRNKMHYIYKLLLLLLKLSQTTLGISVCIYHNFNNNFNGNCKPIYVRMEWLYLIAL